MPSYGFFLRDADRDSAECLVRWLGKDLGASFVGAFEVAGTPRVEEILAEALRRENRYGTGKTYDIPPQDLSFWPRKRMTSVAPKPVTAAWTRS